MLKSIEIEVEFTAWDFEDYESAIDTVLEELEVYNAFNWWFDEYDETEASYYGHVITEIEADEDFDLSDQVTDITIPIEIKYPDYYFNMRCLTDWD